MIVTIDGPAGAGKSSIARRVAEALGFAFLDTGAFYRGVTLACVRDGVAWTDGDAIIRVAGRCELDQRDGRMFLSNEDISDAIRTPEVTASIVHVADVPAVRKILNDHQRRFAADRDVVTEGRDQGTEVFPDATCKIFLTASADERARRRYAQMIGTEPAMTLESIRSAQDRRDAQDAARAMGALKKAEDAVELSTDGLNPDEVLQKVLQIVRDRMSDSTFSTLR